MTIGNSRLCKRTTLCAQSMMVLRLCSVRAIQPRYPGDRVIRKTKGGQIRRRRYKRRFPKDRARVPEHILASATLHLSARCEGISSHLERRQVAHRDIALAPAACAAAAQFESTSPYLGAPPEPLHRFLVCPLSTPRRSSLKDMPNPEEIVNNVLSEGTRWPLSIRPTAVR